MPSQASQDGVLQADYGGFNPRFLGISLFYDSPDSYNAVRSYLIEEDVPDELADGLHSIVIRSVLDHEARHYIDFLLSPYSSAVFKLRLMGLVNGVQVIAGSRNMEGTLLPVPLTRWMMLGETERATVRRDWGEAIGGEVVPLHIASRTREQLESNLAAAATSIADLPDDEQFALQIEAAVRAYLRVDQLTAGFAATEAHPYLRPAYVHEASALTAQVASIYLGQGLTQATDFLEFLVHSELPQAIAWRLHLGVATALEQVRSNKHDSMMSVRRINTVTVWCMLGAYGRDGVRACPASRFVRLVGCLRADPANPEWSSDMDDPEDLERMWDFWDARAEVTPWRDSLSEHLASSRRTAETYKDLLDRWQGPPEVPQLASEVFEMVLADQEKVVSAFRADPRVLATPERYANAEMDLLPVPDVRLEMRGFAAPHDPSLPVLSVSRQSPSGETYASGLAFPVTCPDPEGLEALDRKLQLEYLIEWCDLTFSTLSVPDELVASSRRGLEELSGKTVLQLV